VPDILRTPVCPVFAGAFEIAGGPGFLYLAQAALHAIACWLLFALIRPYFGASAAFWASLLMAIDPLLVLSNFEAMSEPLFLLLVVLSASLVVPYIVAPEGGSVNQAGLCLVGSFWV
jgi:4-amino-4-deoxy-L-arabinose transferase-like glycosyltransferase